MIDVAVYPSIKKFWTYNVEHDIYEEQTCNVTVRSWEIKNIDKYFADITQLINKPIDCFYLIVDWTYYNEIRKEFFEASKKYNIQQLKLISSYQQDATSMLKFISANSDSLWILNIHLHELICAIWEINACNKLNFSKNIIFKRTSRDPSLITADLQKLKNQIHSTSHSPTIVVFQKKENEYSTSSFNQFLNENPNTHQENSVSSLCDFLRIVEKQKKKEIIYNVKPVLGRRIDIKINKDFVGSVFDDCTIPFQKRYCIRSRYNYTINITQKQKDATIDAANYAGWYTVTLLPEPIAALIAYSYEVKIPNKSNVLIFDCGGGTTDICIAKISNQKIKILIDIGDSLLGGKDFDKLLINYFNSTLKNKYGINVLDSNKKYRLMLKCQEIKHTLSAYETAELDVDAFKFDENDVIKITRKEFEDMATDLLLRAKYLIAESLRKIKLHRNDIDIMFQVGGGCRMPMIKKMLKEMFPNAQQKCSIHPEELVAKGAALYAYEMKTTKQ